MSFDLKCQLFRCEICGRLIAEGNLDFCNNCEMACHKDCKEKNQGLCKECGEKGVAQNV